ncbi:hypothetical protein FB45DRAFT_1051600 [Roridomyces roridus]|uniref:BTB domain-containing protein n=1 Tax=Roridomyces roridus TaxID=1738132 RepID=A0AAD7CEM0_9AGAR|nr:hypothetical protein FB45DRAFT_1051600 [Roridomyces roridus]
MATFMNASPPGPFSPDFTICGAPDLILRSSNSIDFYTHKAVLALVSPVFRDMFEFPAPTDTLVEGVDIRNGIPVVQLSETSGAIRQLLLLCYPPALHNEQIKDIDGLYLAHAAADKYQMPAARAAIEYAFTNAVKKEPYRVYAIACHLRLESLAKEAAWETLKDVYRPKGQKYKHPEFELIPAGRIMDLHTFHQECGEKAGAVMSNYQSLDNFEAQELLGDGPYPPWWTDEDHDDQCGAYHTGPDDDYYSPAPWFVDLMDRVSDALQLRPAGETAANVVLNYGGKISGIAACKLCANDAPKYLAEFAETLRKEVDLKNKLELNTWKVL